MAESKVPAETEVIKINKKSREMTTKVSPARRFFARIFDMAIVFAVLLPVFQFTGLLSWSVTNYLIIQGAYTCTFFVYDFIMNSITGGTCGKLLLGLAVAGATKSHLGIVGSFIRSFIFMFLGVGLLIPPLTVITTVICFVLKLKGKMLIWEKKAPVYAHHITGLRVTWSALLVVVILLVGMIPSIVAYLKLVPHYGDITLEEFKEDYDVIEVKYLDSLTESGRTYDQAFFAANKLYDRSGFKPVIDGNGILKGFTYIDTVPFGKEYDPQDRDIVVIGITTLIASRRENRATYNITMNYFTGIFEKPFDEHDITGGGIRVMHSSKKGLDGYNVFYEVSMVGEGTT